MVIKVSLVNYKASKQGKQSNLEKLREKEHQNKYREVAELLREATNPENVQEKWTNIVDVNKKAAEKVLGFKKKKKKSKNKEIIKLSKEQKTLNKLLDAENNQDKRTEIRKERNKMERSWSN